MSLQLLASVVLGHCPTGKYYPSCQLCPQGRYGSGRNTGGISSNCPVCPSGQYQASTGQTSCQNCPAGKAPNSQRSACAGNCKAGSYLNGGTCQKCPAGQYQDTASATSCKACSKGHYCPEGSTAQQKCPPGTYGASTNLGSATCSGSCALGHYCLLGSTSSTQHKCPAGTWGTSTGLSSASCSGKCPAGRICPAGTSTSNVQDCGPPSFYCKEGSKSTSDRIICPSGSYTTGEPNRKTAKETCPKGHYCKDGVMIECPAGRYGSTTGLSTSACSGICTAGYHCPKGSISATQEPCAPPGDPNPASWYCAAGKNRQQITSSDYMSGPLSASERHRESKLPCSANSVCVSGVATPLLQWSSPLEACNARSSSSSTVAWTDPSVAHVTFKEGSGTEGVQLAADLNAAESGAVDISFTRCPKCCTGSSCLGAATPALLSTCRNPSQISCPFGHKPTGCKACLPDSQGTESACSSRNDPGGKFRMDPAVTNRLVPADQVNGLNAEDCTSAYYFQIQASTSAGQGATIFCQLAISVLINKVSGVGALASSTSGGDDIIIDGSNFGPSTETISQVRVWYKTDGGPNIFANSCEVISHDTIECKSSAGVGWNFSYFVEVAQQVSLPGINKVTGPRADARQPRHNGGSYAAPSISTVTRLSGDTLYNANTRGNERVLITGNQFGPVAPWNMVTATFGLPPLAPDAEIQQFKAMQCNVSVAHKEIACFTSEGAGSKHQWIVNIGGLSSVLAETSYGKPEIHKIELLNDSNATKSLSTRGGQTLRLLIWTEWKPPKRAT